MIGFRNAVLNTSIKNWWDNDNKQIAFGRDGKGFIVFNGDEVELNVTLQVCWSKLKIYFHCYSYGTYIQLLYSYIWVYTIHVLVLLVFQTGLPPGEYCDVISGSRVESHCTGNKIYVNNDGRAHFYKSQYAEDMHIAIHVGKEVRVN